MAKIPLPRTSGCLVCGKANPRGLALQLFVDDTTGVVSTDITPTRNEAGFVEVVHGGLTATVADEAMVWAATWARRRFCLAGELTVRFRKPVFVGQTVTFEARVESQRSRLIVTSFRCIDENGVELATGSAKYVPMSADEHARVVESFLSEPETMQAADVLRSPNS